MKWVRSMPGVAVSATLVFALGCSSVEPLGADHIGALEEDEQRLWKSVLEEQARLDRSGAVLDDPVITGYLNAVMQRVTSEQVRRSALTVRVKVLKNPLLNAFAYPNGVIYVHTGILARIENEAQLVTLLGHELTHATHRHAIQEIRGNKRSSAAFATFRMLVLPFGPFGAAASLLGAVGYMASVSGYSKDKEREADREGLDRMVAAGYAPQEAPKLFAHLKREQELRKDKEPFFFGSHPKLVERMESYQDLLVGRYAGVVGKTETEIYQRVMVPVLVENATTDLAIGRYELAEETLSRVLQQEPQHGAALYLLGEIARQRGGEGDSMRSEQYYRQAIAAEPKYAEPHKALGAILLSRGERDAGRVELERYLLLSPQAPDRAYVEQELAQP